MFSAFNPSKCTHTPGAVGHTHTHTHPEQWAIHTHTHTHLEQWATHTHTHTHTPGAVGSRHWRPGRALLKGLTSVVDNSSQSRDSNPQPRVTSLTLYPLGHNCPINSLVLNISLVLLFEIFQFHKEMCRIVSKQ